jgi:hypothetical protein
MAKPTKRSVLEPLTKKRLAESARRLELDIPARTAKPGFVDKLTRSRRIDLEGVLRLFKRDELKAACEDHGLDSSGRSKDPLVERLLGQAPSSESTPAKSRKAAKKSPAPTTEDQAPRA